MINHFRWLPIEQQVAEIERTLARGELILRVVRHYDRLPENNYVTVIFIDRVGVERPTDFDVEGGLYAQKLMMDHYHPEHGAPMHLNTGSARTIRIAAALIDDGYGRLLLVRKTHTRWFMQPGGKIEAAESAIETLQRELAEEIGLFAPEYHFRHLGRFSAPAANEPDHVVDAELFHLRTRHVPITSSEIAEAVWVSLAEAKLLALAPLTRDHILPLLDKL